MDYKSKNGINPKTWLSVENSMYRVYCTRKVHRDGSFTIGVADKETTGGWNFRHRITYSEMLNMAVKKYP